MLKEKAAAVRFLEKATLKEKFLEPSDSDDIRQNEQKDRFLSKISMKVFCLTIKLFPLMASGLNSPFILTYELFINDN